MPAELFPYQKVGAEWLATKKYALLADEMGLGKSAQAIRACDLISAKRVAVLCPAVARLNWLREFEKFSITSRRVSAILTSSSLPEDSSCWVTSYDLLASSAALRSRMVGMSWDVLICDESHYLKNPKANRTKAVFGALAARAAHVWCLSGTPAPNNSSELYPLLRTFGLFNGDYWAFIKRFCVTVDTVYGTQIVGSKNTPELKALIAPVLLRRRKDEVLKDLPPIMFHDVVVEPGPVDYDRWFTEMGQPMPRQRFDREMGEMHAALDAVVNLTGLGRDGVATLGSVAPHVQMLRRYTGLQKVPPVVEMISAELDAKAYEKIVIFAIHQNVIEELQERLRPFGAVKIYGGTPPTKRDAHVRKFQNDPRCRVFIGQVVAAGVAITLTAADQVAFVESSWVPAENAQAVMRVHRIGQSKPVTARFFSLANSSDEKVQKVLRRKTKDMVWLNGPEQPDPALFVNPFDD